MTLDDETGIWWTNMSDNTKQELQDNFYMTCLQDAVDNAEHLGLHYVDGKKLGKVDKSNDFVKATKKEISLLRGNQWTSRLDVDKLNNLMQCVSLAVDEDGRDIQSVSFIATVGKLGKHCDLAEIGTRFAVANCSDETYKLDVYAPKSVEPVQFTVLPWSIYKVQDSVRKGDHGISVETLPRKLVRLGYKDRAAPIKCCVCQQQEDVLSGKRCIQCVKCGHDVHPGGLCSDGAGLCSLCAQSGYTTGTPVHRPRRISNRRAFGETSTRTLEETDTPEAVKVERKVAVTARTNGQKMRQLQQIVKKPQYLTQGDTSIEVQSKWHSKLGRSQLLEGEEKELGFMQVHGEVHHPHRGLDAFTSIARQI
jgi:hypothetical protein